MTVGAPGYCAPEAPRPMVIVRGRVVSCWQEHGRIDVLTQSNELKVIDASVVTTPTTPSCSIFAEGGTWEFHYHNNQYGYAVIDWARREAR